MIKKLLGRLKSEVIMDSYFGEMGVSIDKSSKTYFIDKDIELEGIYTPVILYLEAFDKRSNKRQQKIFESINKDFPEIWHNTIDYLTEIKNYISKDVLKKEYRLESITIPVQTSAVNFEWTMDIINVKDGFSKIIVELENFNPKVYSVEG